MSPIPPAQLRALIEQLLREAPPLDYDSALTDQHDQWLSKAEVAVEAGESVSDIVIYRVARGNINTMRHSRSKVMAPLLNTLYRLELQAPPQSQGYSFLLVTLGMDMLPSSVSLRRIAETF